MFEEGTENRYNVRCRGCGKKYYIDEPGFYQCDCGVYLKSPIAENSSEQKQICVCPYCRSEIHSSALKCSHCGEWVNKSAKDGEKRPTYLMLSFLLGNLGIGEFYIGRSSIGFAYLVLTCLFAYYCPPVCIALWFVACIDAILSDFGLPPEKATIRKRLRIGFFAFLVIGILTWIGIAIFMNT